MNRRATTSSVRVLCLTVLAATALAACGSVDEQIPAVSPDVAEVATGYRRLPEPDVGELSLPDLSADGAEFAFDAGPDRLLVVYFGYTNCPDYCPTTMSDLKLALQRLDPEVAARVDVAMVTVDPDRDLPVLAEYLQSFFPDGHALGTDDDARLRAVAAPFGVSYTVDDASDGTGGGTGDSTGVEVSHTTQLYAIDDAGRLTLTWQFGVSIDDLAADLQLLLDETLRVETSGADEVASS